MNQIERLNRAKIQVQLKNPFFAFLSLHIKFEENKEKCKEKGVAITDEGLMYFDENYISSLCEDELIGLICHEILHLSLLHLLRRKERNKMKWDIASDLVVNSILKENQFRLPPNTPNPHDFGISEVRNKLVEEVFDKLKLEQNNDNNDDENNSGEGENNQSSNSSSSNDNKSNNNTNKSKNNKPDDKPDNKNNNGFDNHLEDDKKGQAEKQKLSDDWLDKTAQAYAQSKLAGKTPLGISRIFDELGKSKIDWRDLLKDYIKSYIPVDFNWSSPGKKSRAIKNYLPSITKEKIDICIAVDTSGSITKKELNNFMTEILEVYSSFKESISLRILSHDVEVQTDEIIEDEYNLDKIKLKGGGGTSHKPIVEHLNNSEDCELCVFITDGYSDLDEIDFNQNNFESIVVISSNGDEKQLKNSGVKIIKIE